MDGGFGIDSLLFTLGLALLTLLSIQRKWSRTERIRGKALGAEVRRAIGLNRLSLYFGLATGALVLLGILAAGTSARARLRNIQTYVGGIAPTLAGELTRHEHWKLDLNTRPEDERYTALDGLLSEWQRLNPTCVSLYTIRKLPNGRKVLILSPPSDYDRNGRIEGELERRDPIGTPYDTLVPEMERAFGGATTFHERVYQDKWGRTLSIFAPVWDPHGRVEAIFGIDFKAEDIEADLRLARLAALAPVGLVALLLLLAYQSLVQSRLETYQEQQTSQTFSRLAITDGLTGALNRRGMEDLFAFELARAQVSGTPLGMVLFDIDHFKTLNDTHGHQAGDAALLALSQLVKAGTRQTDRFARWGGDEFALLCPGANGDIITRIADKLCSDLRVHQAAGLPPFTCSFGVAVSRAEDTMDDLMARADASLYAAKRSGRNRVGTLD